MFVAIKNLLRTRLTQDTRWRLRELAYSTRPTAELWLKNDPSLAISRITPKTGLVIDGFMRSGNTYARAAFSHANGTDLVVASFLHNSYAIRKAHRLGVPIIVTIRHPREAIASLVQYAPGLSKKTALRSYETYYRSAREHLDSIVLADFVEVTTDFGEVIARVNRKFATKFQEYVRTPEHDKEVYGMIDAAYAAGERFASRVPRPSTRRASADEIWRDAGDEERNLLHMATLAYEHALEARSAR